MPPRPRSQPAPDFQPKLAKKARLRFDRHSKKHMLLYPERGLALNESAALIAKLLDGTRTVGQIVHELARDADPALADDIYNDVVGFLEDLSRKGLLECPFVPVESTPSADDDVPR
jgi:coenzyme PQQ biosynthesis protein PqqD